MAAAADTPFPCALANLFRYTTYKPYAKNGVRTPATTPTSHTLSSAAVSASDEEELVVTGGTEAGDGGLGLGSLGGGGEGAFTNENHVVG